MNNRSYNKQYLDKAGMWASALCAIHCMALPVLLSYSVFGGLVLLEHSILENGMIIFSCVIGVASLLPSYVRCHKKIAPIGFFMTGFAMLGLSRFDTNINESLLLSAGATLVASAHFFNYRYCGRSRAADDTIDRN